MGIHHRLLCVIAGCVTVAVFAASPPRLPAPSSGVLDGRVAVLVWPADANGTNEPDLRSPEGCTVHMLSLQDRRESIYDCGAWFRPARGRYIHWMEQDSRISQQSVMRYGDEPFTGRGLMVIKVLTAAGRVQLDSTTKVGATETFRVVSLSDPASKRLFTRRFDAKHARASAMIPAGPVLAGVFSASGDALSLTKPVNVEAGGTRTVSPRPPASGTDVLVTVDRPRSELPCRPDLSMGKTHRQPDVSFQSVQRLVFVWYAVPGVAAAAVTVNCEVGSFTKSIRLAPGHVVTVRHELQNAPGRGTE